jgi:drug/metabolite transporter (DMT)-like permease
VGADGAAAGEGRARVAIAEGCLVTLILGSTLVIAKRALGNFGPLTLAALRYLIAFLLLLPFMARAGTGPRGWPPAVWRRFALIGISFYVVGNGGLFLGLKYLPATTASLLLSLVPLLVLVAGVLWLRETPTRVQMIGVAICVAGSALFFAPGLRGGRPLGLLIVAVALLGNAAFGVLGRASLRADAVDPVALTAIPLAVGAAILLPIALTTEGPPRLSWGAVLALLWLAAINTAAAFFLYNYALRTLTALEMSVLLSLTPLVTALGAWLVLGERLRPVQIGGMIVVVAGVMLVQWRAGKK